MALTPFRYCPVSGNLPMVCTEKGFLASCKIFQKLKAISGGSNFKYRYCSICQGYQVPENITFISLDAAQAAREKTGEVVGINKTVVNKQCEECGKMANLRNSHKKLVCPSCGSVRTVVSSKPEMVIKVLKEFGHYPDAVGGDVSEANETIRKLRAELESRIKDLEYVVDEVKIEKANNDLLRSANETLKLAGENGAGSDVDLNALAWMFAEKIIGGDITGMGMGDLDMIRNAGKSQMESK